MNTNEFCYWLQGYVEMGGAQPTPQQWQMIKDHLATVFTKVTPQRGWEDKIVEKLNSPKLTPSGDDYIKQYQDLVKPEPIKPLPFEDLVRIDRLPVPAPMYEVDKVIPMIPDDSHVIPLMPSDFGSVDWGGSNPAYRPFDRIC